MVKQFRNRTAAGQQLAQRFYPYANHPDVIVLALPRGGVPVAYEIAKALHLPLDLCLVRKLGVPGQPELAMGAIALGGIQVLHQEVVAELGISQQTIAKVAAQERRELNRRELAYRGHRPPPDIRNQAIILVDDGLATGCTMRAAVAALMQQQPRSIIVAIPVASALSCQQLQSEVDRVVCLIKPDPLYAIGNWYEDFSQTTDAEVCDLLAHQPWDRTQPSMALP